MTSLPSPSRPAAATGLRPAAGRDHLSQPTTEEHTMLTVATVITLLIVAPAGMYVGALIERRRHRAAWEQATDQAVQLTQTCHHTREEYR